MEEVKNIAEWQKRYQLGEFDNINDFQSFLKIGWRKWFCDFAELRKETQFLGELISCIGGKRFSLKECYIRLANNHTLNDVEYDSITVYDCKTDDIVFRITYTYGSKLYSAYCNGNWKQPSFKTIYPISFFDWINNN